MLQDEFACIKSTIASATELNYFDASQPITLQTGLGAAIFQNDEHVQARQSLPKTTDMQIDIPPLPVSLMMLWYQNLHTLISS